jgi:hypothetical protein
MSSTEWEHESARTAAGASSLISDKTKLHLIVTSMSSTEWEHEYTRTAAGASSFISDKTNSKLVETSTTNDIEK